jgi:proteasome lid subunit RPN8/RPN11
MESGGFLLTMPGQAHVQMVALAGTVGIVRGPGLFIVTAPALDRLFTHAEQHGLQARAMVHSHPAEAFLSVTDRRYSLRVRGFINAVVPNYASPVSDPAVWGWWHHQADWVQCPPAQIIPDGLASTQVITFDEEGLHEPAN